MRRRLKDYVSLKAVRHIQYLPRAVFLIKNWPAFLSNYLGFTQTCPTYIFRNGIQMKTTEASDVATILDIFIRKDYGDVKDGSIVFDIGANIGVYAIFAATVSRNTVVYAFEPAPENFSLLEENVKINHLEQQIINSSDAVTGKNEKRTLHLSGGPHNSMFEEGDGKDPEITVTCISLESIFKTHALDRCDMLKMDCEGAEVEILEATSPEYFKKIKEIRMEYHCLPSMDYTAEKFVQLLEGKGYAIIKHEVSNETSGLLWAVRNNG